MNTFAMDRHTVRLTPGLWVMVWALLLALAGCASGPAVPNWQGDAHAAQQLAISAELEGHQRVAQVEWRRAREALASTAQPERVARLELSRCAVRQASLDLQPCAGFAALVTDATAAETAYQRYLLAQHSADDVALLPQVQQPVAQAMLAAAGQAPSGAWAERLRQQADPLARLVAASVLLRLGLADAVVQQVAVDAASEQGWRRPLLAWLTLQAETARQSGDTVQAEQIERRRALLQP